MNLQMCEKTEFLNDIREKGHTYFTLKTTERLHSCVERICEEESNEKDRLLGALTELYVCELGLLLSRTMNDSYKKTFELKNPLVIKAVLYINTHIQEKLTVQEVAKACGVSPEYLSALLKRHLNLTAKDCINIDKVDHAMSTLMSTDLSITEVAKRFGFSSTQYFSTVFKRYAGVTPSEYRMKAKEASF